MSHTERGQPNAIKTNGVRAIVRQNSYNVAISFGEDVDLPENSKSLRRDTAQDVEVGVVREQANPSISQPTSRQYPKSFWLSLDDRRAFPFFMLTISLTQVMVYSLGGEYFWLKLCYDPYRRHEVWRFFTIMFVHTSGSHLAGNLVFQFILGVLLEIVHHWRRVGIIYTAGVLGGTLFITIATPNQYVVGASAGVYALLFAHVATILLNWNQMGDKACRVFWLFAYIAFDVGLTFYNEMILKKDLNISHAAHLGGAVTGFLISILVLKNFEVHFWEKTLQKICAAILVTLALIIVIINIAFPSMYSESEFNTVTKLPFS